jgi:hypothetical protein
VDARQLEGVEILFVLDHGILMVVSLMSLETKIAGTSGRMVTGVTEGTLKGVMYITPGGKGQGWPRNGVDYRFLMTLTTFQMKAMSLFRTVRGSNSVFRGMR